MKLVIPGEFTDLNTYIRVERGNRYASAGIKKRETDRVFWECRKQRLSAKLGRLDYTFTWFVRDRRKDPDNIAFATKFILDGLVKAGIIESDTQAHVGRITHNPIEVDRKAPRVVVQLETNKHMKQRSGGEAS